MATRHDALLDATASRRRDDDAAPPVRSARIASRTIGLERDALDALATLIDEDGGLAETLDRAVELIVQEDKRVVVTGIGKSGLVGRKLAATLSSTGTPSLFVHAAEASHGDLGSIMTHDVVLALSWSGETSELSDIIGFSRRRAIPVIAITASAASTLARHADLCMILPAVQEACPHDLAPTCSTVMQMALGDALAIALLERRSFSREQFSTFHPRGALASRLATVRQLMTSGAAVPRVGQTASVGEAIVEMSGKRFGITAVVDDDDRLIGAFSDGDLRRCLVRGTVADAITRHMNRDPLVIDQDSLASDAVAAMTRGMVTQLFICDDGRLTGILHLHDALRAKGR